MNELTTIVTAIGPGGFSAGGVITFLIFAYLRGWLIPRSWVDAQLAAQAQAHAEVVATKDQQMAGVQELNSKWEDAWRESQGIAAEVRSQNRDLVASLRDVNHVVRSLPTVPVVEGVAVRERADHA